MDNSKSIYVKILKINGKRYKWYSGDQEIWYEGLDELLRKEFRTQGEFYQEICGVSYEDAERVGWHP